MLNDEFEQYWFRAFNIQFFEFQNLNSVQVLIHKSVKGSGIVEISHVGNFAVLNPEVIGNICLDGYATGVGSRDVRDNASLVAINNNVLWIVLELGIASFDTLDPTPPGLNALNITRQLFIDNEIVIKQR